MATTMDQRRIIGFDKGWERIEIGIAKLIREVEGSPNTEFSSEEYMMLYTTIYNMCGYGQHGFSQNFYDECEETIPHGFSQNLCDECKETIRYGLSQNLWEKCQNLYAKWKETIQHGVSRNLCDKCEETIRHGFSQNCYDKCKETIRHDFSPNLYDKCKETIDEFNRSNVLPFLSGKLDELLLRELVQRMLIHKTFVTRLSHLFAVLKRYIVARSLPPLNKLGLSSFRDVVFMEVHANATKAVIDLIRKDRAGEQIDKLLLKNVIDIFVEIGMGDIELLDETANDYKRKAEPEPELEPLAKTCETMFDIKAFKKSIEGLITLNYIRQEGQVVQIEKDTKITEVV
ncbi:unnamed protein product [Trifolium pratense]|uniref:Uncharacterized protein n=1 Tax=Trifolium pratense TaxID=57577 RepID=A0ACB0K0S5_TRIPR|nr:unnamed protein product [Trifolium pratense]